MSGWVCNRQCLASSESGQVLNLRELRIVSSEFWSCVFTTCLSAPCHRSGLFILFQMGFVTSCFIYFYLLWCCWTLPFGKNERKKDAAFHKCLLKDLIISQSCSCGFGVPKVVAGNWWPVLAATQRSGALFFLVMVILSKYGVQLWLQMLRNIRVSQAFTCMKTKLLGFFPHERRQFVVKVYVCVLCLWCSAAGRVDGLSKLALRYSSVCSPCSRCWTWKR